MPLLSSHILVRTHAFSLLTVAYYLLTAPHTLLSSAPIWLLGEAMSIRPAEFAPEHLTINKPQPKAFRPPALTAARAQPPAPAVPGTESERELFALLALVLLVYAIGQFLFAGDLAVVLASSSPTPAQGKPSSPSKSSSRLGEELHTLLSAQSRWLTLAGLHVLGAALFVFWIYAFHSHALFGSDNAIFPSALRLANRVTFTAGLADMLFWGYLWTVLKEEGRWVGSMLARRREIEDEDEKYGM
ncbi:hypothetical protein EDD36DRAFT_210299 [Exophiala viscosa]|uniref:Uncharacterized protein n=1 Tax=Exophiala viscosa TaxID=2486360 RepID=A0AAN6IDI9_9EURO|nr:hypothetical protein EDD36DRAFT_210299 [Exophiala viscosa]